MQEEPSFVDGRKLRACDARRFRSLRAIPSRGETVMRINLRAMLLAAGLSLIVSNPCALAHTDVAAQQARDLIESTNDLIVVDVREPYEYCDATGHIPGALNYPWSSGVLGARYEELPTDGPVLVVCRSGGRSNAAASFLDSKGFQEVYDMLRGMSAWQWETAPCKYSGGSGTADEPYRIATAADLIALGETPEDYDKHFTLTADIDMHPSQPASVFDRAIIAPDANDTEEGFQGTPFSGVFDGNRHAISHLTITGQGYLGLFGQLRSGAEVKNLGLVDVNITGLDFHVGGLVGSNYGSITSSYIAGSVSGDISVGGLVGSNHGSITSSYSNSSVSGDHSVGGLVGENSYIGSITSSYSTGSVSGDISVGGLVGSNWYMGRITSSYSTGSVSGDHSVGGLVGNNWSGITSSFWDTEASGATVSAGGTGLTTTEMQNINTYLAEGWDFVDETANGTSNFWQIQTGTYPALAVFSGIIPLEPNGTGTLDDPYLLTDANELGAIWYRPLAHYCLAADIDLSGMTWATAVVPWFGGSLNGNGYVISNLHIDGGGYLGLFGELEFEAIISNIGLEAVDVNGTSVSVGGLVGSNYGSITSSYSAGLVYGNSSVSALVGSNIGGNNDVGGLVGSNYGIITLSYSTGSVSGDISVGGLVGSNHGSITSSYSTSSVSGNISVGGLVGTRGLVVTGGTGGGEVMESFWDTETSGQITSDGGTGKTTAEMQMKNTFTDAKWDFVDETDNGTEDIWWILEGQDYPRLWWEASGQ